MIRVLTGAALVATLGACQLVTGVDSVTYDGGATASGGATSTGANGTGAGGSGANGSGASGTGGGSPCNNNDTCDVGETRETCPAECTCGDGECLHTSKENSCNCQLDCGEAFCGDGCCSDTEIGMGCDDCPSTCGNPPDCQVDQGEDCANCSDCTCTADQTCVDLAGPGSACKISVGFLCQGAVDCATGVCCVCSMQGANATCCASQQDCL